MGIKTALAAMAAAAALALAAAVVLVLGGAPAPAHALTEPSPEYYLALGGSLSRGSQPDAQGKTHPTNRGYTNDLYVAEEPDFANLQLVEMGCPGETTTTMIKGGKCRYAAGSQLSAAVQFLHAHKGHIAFVTIDIGANDIDPCFTPTKIHQRCFDKADATVQANLPTIARRLRKAAGKHVPLLSSTYYDPYLASWFRGNKGRKTASQSRGNLKTLNKQIASDFGAKNFEIAPVAGAFHTYESLNKTRFYRKQFVPASVVVICKKTWMCAPKPRGPDIHPNTSGYLKIAKAFEEEPL